MDAQERFERRKESRAKILKLSASNEPFRVAQAIKITGDTLQNLKPLEPPNLEDLLRKLDGIPINTGGKPMAEVLDILTESWRFDTKRCVLIVQEWYP